jgi:hypothetical protein
MLSHQQDYSDEVRGGYSAVVPNTQPDEAEVSLAGDTSPAEVDP